MQSHLIDKHIYQSRLNGHISLERERERDAEEKGCICSGRRRRRKRKRGLWRKWFLCLLPLDIPQPPLQRPHLYRVPLSSHLSYFHFSKIQFWWHPFTQSKNHAHPFWFFLYTNHGSLPICLVSISFQVGALIMIWWSSCAASFFYKKNHFSLVEMLGI